MIWHLVPADRSRFSYFRARCYAEGLSKALVTASVGAGDGLSSERRYTTRTLPSGVAAGLADAFRGDVSGLTRAGAITAGLTATVAGYAAGSVRTWSPAPPASPPARERSWPHDDREADAVPILMYHEIAPPSETASRLAVPPGAFAAQLAYLHDEGFTTLTADVAAAALAGGSHRSLTGQWCSPSTTGSPISTGSAAAAGAVRLHGHGLRDDRLGPGRRAGARRTSGRAGC